MPTTVNIGSVSVQWGGPEFKKKVDAAAVKGLEAAATHLRLKMRANLTVQGYPVARRSRPGEFPRMDTTSLVKSITATRASESNLSVGVGVRANAMNDGINQYISNVHSHHGGPTPVNDYALWLEFGTKNMAPRPFMLRTLLEESDKLFTVFSQTFTANLSAGPKVES